MNTKNVGPGAGSTKGPRSTTAKQDCGLNNASGAQAQAVNAVDGITAHRLMLKEAGYHPIPVNGKIPVIDEWEQQIDASDEVIKGWGPSNTGLLTKYTPTLDCDILNAEAVAAVEKLAHEKFAERGCILTRTGLAPKIAIPFRTDTPFKKISVMLTAPDSSTGQKFEFLGDGQQFVGFGKHPDTHKSYQWNGGGKPGPVRHDQLPLINEEEARVFIEEAVKLVEQFGYQRAAASKGNGSDGSHDPFKQAEWDANKTKAGKLNDAALANLAAWVLMLFPAAWEDRGGFRVSSADRGPGDTCHCCGRPWREHQEDISFQPNGIRDYAVGDEGDRKEGKRSPIDIVMEHVFFVPAVDLAEREHTPEFEQAFEWLSKLVYGAAEPLDETVSGVGPAENVVQFPATSAPPLKKPEKVLPRLPRISNKDLRSELLEHVSWVVDKIFVAGAVNGLFGEGAVGKDQLLYQLALAWVSGAKWLGIDVPTTWNGEPIRVLWFPVEDPKKELRRRQHNIETYYAQHDEVFDPQDDNLQIIPQLGKDTVIAIYDREAGVVKPTSLYTQMCTEIDDFKPHVVIVGNRVNIFSVNQNDDAQARQCINLLNHLCEKYGVTVIMPAHPSQTGKNTGSGESGSVQWNNAVRQRVYISKLKEEEKGDEPADKDVRQLEVKKSNWGASGETLTMKWTAVIDENGECYGGVFVEDQVVQVKKTDESGMPKSEAQIKAEEAQLKAEENKKIEGDFMRYFDQLMQIGVSMRPDPNSRSGPATLFTTLSECKYKSKKGKALMRDAMMRLSAKGIIKSVPDKPLWRHVKKLVRGVDENGKVFQT